MSDNSPLTRMEFNRYMEQFTGQLNSAFGYMYRRLDDLEHKLEKIESRTTSITHHTEQIRKDMRIINNA